MMTGFSPFGVVQVKSCSIVPGFPIVVSSPISANAGACETAGRARRRRSLVLAATLLALAGCVSKGDPSRIAPIAIEERAALGAVNDFRARNDLPPLQVDPRLTEAARDQSDAMAARGVMGHDVAGKLPNRLTRRGYAWSATAENIGRGYADYRAAMAGWIGSDSHRRNLLNPRVTHIGFAGTRDESGNRNYWTQIFGAERATAQAAPAPVDGGWWPPR